MRIKPCLNLAALRGCTLVTLLVLLVAACGVSPANLNSDRIKLRYGSYQVRVLYQDEDWRVSSLESRHDAGPVTRTLALVRYEPIEDRDLEIVDRRIRAGRSIGRTFRMAGWDIDKPAIFVGEVRVPQSAATVSRLMKIALPEKLAAHAYRFEISDDDKRYTYATIIELHHPDYMSPATLRGYYPPPADNDSASAAIDVAVRMLSQLPTKLAD